MNNILNAKKQSEEALINLQEQILSGEGEIDFTDLRSAYESQLETLVSEIMLWKEKSEFLASVTKSELGGLRAENQSLKEEVRNMGA